MKPAGGRYSRPRTLLDYGLEREPTPRTRILAAIGQHGPMIEDDLFEVIAPIKGRKHPRCYRGSNRRILCGWFYVALWSLYADGLIETAGGLIQRPKL